MTLRRLALVGGYLGLAFVVSCTQGDSKRDSPRDAAVMRDSGNLPSDSGMLRDAALGMDGALGDGGVQHDGAIDDAGEVDAAVPLFTLEAEALLPPIASTATAQSQADCCGVSFSGGAQLLLSATAAGQGATIEFDVPGAGHYDLSAIMLRGPDHGQVRFAIDGVAIGQLFDGYAASAALSAPTPIGSASLSEGTHELTITALGKEGASSGFLVGIDTLTFDWRANFPSLTNTAYSLTAETPSAGTFTVVYNPSVGESGAWYYNDHTIIKHHQTGTWHVFAITHAEPPNPQDEKNFGHATADSLAGPWTKQPFALTADAIAGELYIWAPYVLFHDDTYYMFYAAGTSNLEQYRIHLATSADLVTWTRSPSNPLFYAGWEGRDPMVIRVGDEWVMYYTATSEPGGGNHIVAYRTSTNLLDWGPEQVAFTHPKVGMIGGPTESPFVVHRGDQYYLFVCCEGDDYDEAYRNTVVYRSQDPLRFEHAHRIGGILDTHAAEVVVDEGSDWFITHAGWGQGGLSTAPLTWTSSEVARGRIVQTAYLEADIQTWPATRLSRLGVDPSGGGAYQRALDSSYRTTAPYLAIGAFGPTDLAGAPARVDVSSDGTRIDLVGIPLGTQPVTADWLFTFDDRALQHDLVYSVAGALTGPVWEVSFVVDTSLPNVGDPTGEDLEDDIPSFAAWVMGSGLDQSMVTAYRTGSAFRTDNRWFEKNHGMIAWQPIWDVGGTTWPAGHYRGGTFRMAATSTRYDTAFAAQLATELDTVR